MQTISDLEVDHIIEKVLIKGNSQRYNYLNSDSNQLTPSEHLWHFQLQEENVELKNKINELKRKSKKIQERFQKEQKMVN